MKGLYFEQRGEGSYYKVILHIGNCYVPVSDDIVEELSMLSSAPTERFLSVFLRQLEYSSYLKDQIQAELDGGNHRTQQVEALQQFLRILK